MNTKIKRLSIKALVFCLTIILAVGNLSTISLAVVLPFVSSFDNGSYSNWDKIEVQANGTYTLQSFVDGSTTVYPRAGAYMMRFQLDRGDPLISNGCRSELATYAHFYPNTEYWYAYSIYLPSNYQVDTNPGTLSNRDILAQWHGEISSNVPITFSTGTYNGTGYWYINRNPKGTPETNPVVPYESDRGKWTDWKFHIKWSPSDGSAAILEAWKDGVLVFNKNGLANCPNSTERMNFKCGIYKNAMSDPNYPGIPTRVVYHDEVRMGTTEAQVAIPGSTSLTISSATASADDGAGAVAANSIDNNTNTYWAGDCASVQQWLKLDLGSSKTVGSAQIAWYNGNGRVYGFKLQTSTDNTNWTDVYFGHSSGTGTGFETANFADVSARYVRILGSGNSVNTWCSVAEVKLYGSDGNGNAGTYAEQATPTVTASADDGAGSVVGNTRDNNLGTRWAADCTSTTQWAKYDLGSARAIDKLSIAYHYSDARRYNITIQVSKDGTTWTDVWTGQSILMPTTSFETYDFADKTARYVRIVGNGNTVNRWTSITEVDIYGY